MLNEQNYFSQDNKYLSNSKVSDWLKDKNYFYKKHITGEIKSPTTDAMVIGSAVDEWLTGSKEEFKKKYTVVTRRSKTSDTPWRYQLNNTMYNEIESMCSKAEQSDVVKSLKDHTAQDILRADIDLKHFKGVCGIPDWYILEDSKCIITDLKTAQSIIPDKYHWKCQELGYYRQQAFYQILIQKIHNVTDFVSRHLVIEKDPDNINHIATFILDQSRIEKEKEFLFQIFEDIKNEESFESLVPSWKDAIVIGAYDEML